METYRKTIIAIKPDTLSAKDKEKLTKAGYIVITHPDPYMGIVFKDMNKTEYEHINCYKCGERIYLLPERLSALKSNRVTFFCSQGHSQSFTLK